jgi:hypothetical protein
MIYQLLLVALSQFLQELMFLIGELSCQFLPFQVEQIHLGFVCLLQR